MAQVAVSASIRAQCFLAYPPVDLEIDSYRTSNRLVVKKIWLIRFANDLVLSQNFLIT